MTLDQALELLPDYVLGAVSEAERAAIEALMVTSPELAREAGLIEEAMSWVAVGLPRVSPSSKTRARVLASAAKDRFLPFVDLAARLCDLAVERMQELLRWIDQPERWEGGPFDGIRLIHFDHGPQCLAIDTGFVRLPAGLEFPVHRHLGPEVNLILTGRVIDDDGTVYLPGDVVAKTVADVHGYRVGEESDLIIVALNDGFELV